MMYTILISLAATVLPAQENSFHRSSLVATIPSHAQQDPPDTKMSAVEFKNQEYCRAELLDFDFDAHFSVVSADVYFSGANFRDVTLKGSITSNSLKPIRKLMDRCTPGTIVSFDNVKVIGPDKQVRTIRGLSFILF